MPSNTGNVWVIDDDESIRWVLEKGLSQSNINVSTFSNADDAIKKLKKEKSCKPQAPSSKLDSESRIM